MAQQNNTSSFPIQRLPTELLQHVLFMMPSTEILTNVMTVSRQWKAAIEGSTDIQQKLFLKPPKDGEEGVVKPRLTTIHWQLRPRLNTILGQLPTIVYMQTLEHNTILYTPSPIIRRNRAESTGTMSDGTAVKRLEFSAFEQVLPPAETNTDESLPWNRKNASWRKMFVTKPACSLLRLECIICSTEVNDVVEVWLRDAKGIRMGLVADIVDAVKKNAVAYMGNEDHVERGEVEKIICYVDCYCIE